MSISTLTKMVIGPGHVIADRNPVPMAFRQTPQPLSGVQPTTPTGGDSPTGSIVSTTIPPL